MSIGVDSVGGDAIAAQPQITSKDKGGPPPRRVAVATSDAVAQPEPR
jgi:hypothetical protein